MAEDGRTAFEKVLDIDAPGTPLETAGSWSALVRGLGFSSDQELFNFIEGKNVLDVGSGMGGLFKEAMVRGSKAKIFNVNPRFSLEGHAREAHEMYEMMAEELPENIEEINRAHDEFSLAAFSNKLPVRSNSVGVVIDNKAAVYHCLYEDRFDDLEIIGSSFNPNEKALSETLDEYLRVLERNGKARIGGLLPEFEESLDLLRKKLTEKGIEFSEIKNGQGEIVAVEMEKK